MSTCVHMTDHQTGFWDVFAFSVEKWDEFEAVYEWLVEEYGCDWDCGWTVSGRLRRVWIEGEKQAAIFKLRWC